MLLDLFSSWTIIIIVIVNDIEHVYEIWMLFQLDVHGDNRYRKHRDLQKTII